MFSLFSLNWKVIPVYVAETASKDLRSSMNNVTNISQVPSLKKYQNTECRKEKMINTCQPVNNQRNVKKSQLQNVGYVLLYLFSLHLSWRPLSALLVSCPGEPFLFYFIVFALVFAYVFVSCPSDLLVAQSHSCIRKFF